MRKWLLLVPFLAFAGCDLEPVMAQVVYFTAPPFTLVNGAVIDATQVMGDFNRIVSDGNTAYANFLAQIASLSGTPTPAGAVVPFNLSACPTGWVASNGSGGTVDLRGKFVRTTTGSPAVGTVQADQIINHFHQVPGAFIGSLTISTLAITTSSSIFFTSAQGSAMTVGAPNSGNHGSETRPKNVALLYCQKT